MTVLPDPPPEPGQLPPSAVDDARRAGSAAPGRGRPRARLARATPFIAGVLVTLLIVLGVDALRSEPPPLTPRDVRTTIDEGLASQTPGPPASELVYDVVRPSIVADRDRRHGRGRASPPRGEGTGVVVNDQGEVLTALHVVADATAIDLTFADGSREHRDRDQPRPAPPTSPS